MSRMFCHGIVVLALLAHSFSLQQGCSVLTQEGCRLCKSQFLMTHSHLCIKPTTCGFNNLNQCLNSYQSGIGCILQGLSCVPNSLEQNHQKYLIPGCLQYSQQGCIKCESSRKLSEMVCIIANCESRQIDSCQKCMNGFEVTQRGYCSQISKRIPHCLSATGSQCVLCAVDYWVVNGVCIPQKKGCIYTIQGCTSCLAGYSYSNSTCWMDGCLEFHQNGQCKNCDYPFVKHNDGLCKVYFCAEVVNKTCLRCDEGSRMDKEGRCFQIDNNCVRYSQKSAQCEECAAHYFPEGSRCVHYDQNCLQFESGDVCIACNRMYYLNQHQVCRIRDRKCTVYINGFCAECILGFQLIQGVCKKKFKETEYLDCEAVLQHGGGSILSRGPNELIISLDRPRSLCGFHVSDQGSSNLSHLDVQFSRNNQIYRKIGRFAPPPVLKNYVQIHKFYKTMEASYFKIISSGQANLQVDLYVETYRRVKRSRAYFPTKSLVKTANNVCAMVTCGEELSCMATIQSTRLLSTVSISVHFQSSPTVEPMFLLKYSLDGHKFVCLNECVPIKLMGTKIDYPQLQFQQLQMRLINAAGSCWGITLQ